jgi:hypothetical protein
MINLLLFLGAKMTSNILSENVEIVEWGGSQM